MKVKSFLGFNGFFCSMNILELGVGILIIVFCLKFYCDRCEICENGDKSLRNCYESYWYNVLKIICVVGMYLY